RRCTAVEAPRQAEARERNRKPRLVQLRAHPAPAAVDRDLDALDPSTSRPRQAGHLVEPATWKRLASGGERDDRLRFHLIREYSRLPVRHQVGVLRGFIPGHVSLIGELQAV